MLCRTASDLYWMARYVERAENMARVLGLAQRISLLPERLDPGKSPTTAWYRALDALGLVDAYAQACGKIEAGRVLAWLTLDAGNPASILNCMSQARELGRAQRGAITAEMYQDLNTSWLEISEMDAGSLVDDGVTPLLEWVKTRSAAFRGVTIGTLGRDEGYHFMTLGTFVERADNTVRLLDIKYAQADDSKVHESRDFIQYYQWSAMLQAMSAFETYRKIYRDSVNPVSVAELMIFEESMPHSLVVCCRTLRRVLESLAGSSRNEAVRLAGALAASLRYGRMQDVMEQGMQAFLDDFMRRLGEVTEAIVKQFMTSRDVGVAVGSAQDQQSAGAMVS